MNVRTAARRSGSGAGPRAAFFASCMSTQRWHWLRSATVRTTVSRECGSRVADSKIALSTQGATASETGRRLGVSKQAAGKTVDRLLALGYAERADDPTDARRKPVRLTPRGYDALARSAAIFDELRAEWVAALGAERVRDLEGALRNVVPADTAFRLDATSRLGAP